MFLKSIQKYTLLVLLITSPLQAHKSSLQETLLTYCIGVIGQSDFIHFCSKKIQTPLDQFLYKKTFNIGNEPASQKYQELGSQAQYAVGIPEEWHVPIFKLNPESPLTNTIAAMAQSNGIYVNEERLDALTFGQARCVLFHEAIHAKYHDSTCDTMLELATIILGSMLSHSILQKLNITSWNKLLSLVIALGISTSTSTNFHNFIEHRADTQGHYATQCSQCIHEHAQRRKTIFEDEHHPLKDYGYLWAHDVENIAHNLDDKKCDFHKNNE